MKYPRHRAVDLGLCLLTLACITALPAVLGACESDDTAGTRRTTTKETVSTPEGHETITTTHEKKTEVYPK